MKNKYFNFNFEDGFNHLDELLDQYQNAVDQLDDHDDDPVLTDTLTYVWRYLGTVDRRHYIMNEFADMSDELLDEMIIDVKDFKHKAKIEKDFDLKQFYDKCARDTQDQIDKLKVLNEHYVKYSRRS